MKFRTGRDESRPQNSRYYGPDYVSTREAAELLGVSIYTVRRLCHAGELHGYRLTDRGLMRIERASVEQLRKWLAAQESRELAALRARLTLDGEPQQFRRGAKFRRNSQPGPDRRVPVREIRPRRG